MSQYLAGVDVGTNGARCLIFDLAGRPVAGHYCEYGASYPQPGWVEQDANLLIARTREACRQAIGRWGGDPRQIAAVGFSAQRSVTCLVDARGSPVRPLFSWQDARTGEQVERLRQVISADAYYAQNGLPLGTTWIITKLLWMREHEPELFERTARVVQNQDLVLRAFGADDYYTDRCCAVFYGVWDIHRATWNQPLLDRLGLCSELFGRPTAPGTQVGTIGPSVAEQTGFAPGTPLCLGAGDQNCSVLGMGAVQPGLATVTLGTAGLAILATARPVNGFGGMMITHHAAPGMWQVEGLSNAAAASLRWFRDLFPPGCWQTGQQDKGDAYQQLDQLASRVPPGGRGLLFLPYLATAASPHWNADARAAFVGLSFAHGRAEMARAVMEGVALEIRDMLQQWRDAGLDADSFRIGGGATRSKLWNQIQADIYGRPVETLKVSESTGLGAALMGGVGAGPFGSIQEAVEALVHVDQRIDPRTDRRARYEDLYHAYTQVYRSLDTSGAFARLARIQAAAGNPPQ